MKYQEYFARAFFVTRIVGIQFGDPNSDRRYLIRNSFRLSLTVLSSIIVIIGVVLNVIRGLNSAIETVVALTLAGSSLETLINVALLFWKKGGLNRLMIELEKYFPCKRRQAEFEWQFYNNTSSIVVFSVMVQVCLVSFLALTMIVSTYTRYDRWQPERALPYPVYLGNIAFDPIVFPLILFPTWIVFFQNRCFGLHWFYFLYYLDCQLEMHYRRLSYTLRKFDLNVSPRKKSAVLRDVILRYATLNRFLKRSV